MGITIKRISVIISVLTLSTSTLALAASSYSFSSSFILSVDAQKDQKPQVKITYPEADQHIPSGRLTIYGTSSDSHLTLCQVFVLLNDERPYQNATATGREGKDDYSKWTFTFDPYYSLIREGANELVSKVICHYNDGTNSTSHNKINVTGEGSARTDLINQSQQATGIVPSPKESASNDVPTPNPNPNPPVGPFFIPRQ